MLSQSKALDIAEQMGVLKFFPAGEKAVLQIVKILCEICRDAGEGDRLLSAMLERFNEWPGPVAMRDLQHSLRSRSQGWQGFGSKPKIDCTGCNDFGHVGGVRCSCKAGESIPDEFLLAFKALAKRSQVITGPERKKTIAEDTARVNRSLMEY